MWLAENCIDRPFGKGLEQSRAAAFKGLRLESPLHHIWLKGGGCLQCSKVANAMLIQKQVSSAVHWYKWLHVACAREKIVNEKRDISTKGYKEEEEWMLVGIAVEKTIKSLVTKTAMKEDLAIGFIHGCGSQSPLLWWVFSSRSTRAAAVPGVLSAPLLSSPLPEIFHAAATSQSWRLVGQFASSFPWMWWLWLANKATHCERNVS